MTLHTPPGRYGERRAPRVFYAVGGVLLLAGTVIVLLIARKVGSPEVSYGVRSFQTAPRSVAITFEVRKDPHAAAVCVLRARDRYGAEVGRREVAVPNRPDGGRTTVLQATVTTSGRPVTGEVRSCRLTG